MGLQPGDAEVWEASFCPHSAFELKSNGMDAQETRLPMADELSSLTTPHYCRSTN